LRTKGAVVFVKKHWLLLSVLVLVVALFGSLVSACGEDEATTTTAGATATTAGGATDTTAAGGESTTVVTTGETVVLKMASAATGNYVDIEQEFVDAFNARCAPAYVIEFYPSEQMLGFFEMLDGIRTNACDLAALTPNFYSADDERLGVVELPFLLNNLQAHIAAIPKLMPLYGGILEEKFNQKLVGLHNYTGMALLSKKPVKTLDDWKGLLVQSLSPITADMLASLGASPVTGQPYTEGYSLLEKGTVDAVINAPASMRIFSLTDVAKYCTWAYMTPAVHGYSVNLDVWNSLPPDIQTAMSEEAVKNSAYIDQWMVDEWERDKAAILEAGVEIYEVPQDEIDKWKEACQPVWDEQMAKLGEFGQQVKAICDEANAQYPNQ